MSRERKEGENELFVVYRGRGGIMTKVTAISGKPLDEVPLNEKGEVDISGLAGEIIRASQTRQPLDSVPFKRHHRH